MGALANNEEEKVTAQYLYRIEKRIDKQDTKIEEIDTKVDQRHIDIVKMSASMEGAQAASNRMADSIDKLVTQLENSNARHDKRFESLSVEISDVKGKIESQEDARKIKLEEKKMSNAVLLSIIAGSFTVVQVLINLVGPMFF